MDWYRYIFWRLYRFQIPRAKKPFDAYMAALSAICIPWMIWLVFVDGVIAGRLNAVSIIDDLGKWPVLVVAGIVVFAINHGLLKREYSKSGEWFEQSKYHRWGTWMGLAYFALPVLAIVVLEVT